MRRVILWISLILCPSLGFLGVGPFASATDVQIQNLLNRFGPSGRLVQSYQNSNRAFLYDQALAVIAFSQAGERQAAEKVLASLEKFQSPDGSWAFQYMSTPDGVEPAEQTVSPSGAIAWVAMAIEAYEKKFGSQRYHPTLIKTLSYLEAQRVKVSWSGKTSHPVRFSPTRPSIVAFEHNLDSYVAFANAGSKHYNEVAADLRVFLESMWDQRRFYAGFNLEDNQPNRDENYLDTQSWGVLALGPTGLDGQDFAQGLKTNCDEFVASGTLSTSESSSQSPRSSFVISGFVAYHPRGRTPAATAPVWSEGSFGMLLSMKIAGQKNCGGSDAPTLARSLDRMTFADGGVAYATASGDPDFSSASSVAGTAWKYFLQQGYNPFQRF
jgi:hypothetical protein